MSDGPAPRTFKLVLEYDGGAYSGWQIQHNGVTIQQILEEKLAILLRAPVRVTGSGRTDAGVHALGQVASFRAATARDPADLRYHLNALLPPDISVREAELAADDFDARHSARGKLYRYQLWNSPRRGVFTRDCAYWVKPPLDVGAMREAASRLLGEHDFSAFRASDCQAKNAVRILHRLDVVTDDAPLLRVEAEATAFLKHMVRTLVGTLVQVGLGRRTPDDVAAVLASKDRKRAGPTAPPHGLFLVEVRYP